MLREAAHSFRARLLELRLARFPELARLIEHEDRATRSDLLEGIGMVMEVELLRTDIKSLRVGWRRRFRRGGRAVDFIGLPRETVAKWCGLSESTVSRAFTILRRAGLLCGPGRDGFNVIRQPREEKPDGSYEAFAAVRRVTELFFVALGMGGWLANLRAGTTARALPLPGDVAGTEASRHAAASGRLVAELAHRLALERPPDG